MWSTDIANAVYTLWNSTLLKMLGCFNPILGQIWANPAIGLNFLKFNPMAGFVHIWPKIGLKQPSIF